MAKTTKSKTKLPQDSKHSEGGVANNSLGGVAERMKAVAAKVEAMVGDASAKGRERIKPVVEKLRAKWHEIKGDEPADESRKTAAAVKTTKTVKKKAATKKKKVAKPAKKAVKSKSRSTRKAKRPKKGAKKKA